MRRHLPDFWEQLAGAVCPALINAKGGGGGKGGGTPAVPPPPPPPAKPQAEKPVTEAATAARNAQKDRAARGAGIAGSILTTPLASDTADGSTTAARGKTLLGQ